MGQISSVDLDSGKGLLGNYDPGRIYCELLGGSDRSTLKFPDLWRILSDLDIEELRARATDATSELLDLGITFTVYTDRDAIDRILPFDIIPRVIPADEWRTINSGVVQRVKALNLFLHDIYHDAKILKDGVVPEDLVRSNVNYRTEMRGYEPPCGTYVHIAGVDLIRDRSGQFLVLEDNARTPSGVSYVLENRNLMQRAFPDLLEGVAVRPVSDYGARLHDKLCEVAPPGAGLDPQIALLSPGIYNSAYFEHIFLARQMGVPLVEGRDLIVENDRVFMKTIAGLQRVDVLYRRLDDAFLDPECFNPNSMLGVPGLMRAARAGHVALANAVGNGVADDKAVYAYMPRIIEYYLSERPILQNVQTHICREADALAYTLDNLDKLVVKPVGESGGYGIMVGPKSTASEREECAALLKANPSNFISQPMIELSVSPTLTERGVVPCHVDLRPFAVTGKETWVLPGGLTRVAMKPGSIIVNSSQGGGTKDTWVLEADAR
ncbi:MAG: circularly permuted type 2 ATP-grasp protein [Hyphomicrobiaceae bacterium]|nr:circularly permuted type 2 ATP-grasp protein [Hyphomicrobiaceae bacterium]MCC0008380.1 circularly permuted type 2 ATP-grasp protein [Hyphomicrobiaceae bacterium]